MGSFKQVIEKKNGWEVEKKMILKFLKKMILKYMSHHGEGWRI